ncbi:hypothetical protein GCM10027058_18890 [Microbacterium neimengense]
MHAQRTPNVHNRDTQGDAAHRPRGRATGHMGGTPAARAGHRPHGRHTGRAGGPPEGSGGPPAGSGGDDARQAVKTSFSCSIAQSSSVARTTSGGAMRMV